MVRKRGDSPGLPTGEQPVIERTSAGPVVADTFAGRIHVEWDNSATVTPLGQLRVDLFEFCGEDFDLPPKTRARPVIVRRETAQR